MPLNIFRVLWITLGLLGNVAVVLTFFQCITAVALQYTIPGNCRAEELTRPGTLLLEISSIQLGAPLAPVKLAIAQKFFRDANLSWFNEKSCFTSKLIWTLVYRRRTTQLLRLGLDIISTTVAMLIGHCVMGRYAEKMSLPFSYFCRECKYAMKRRLFSTFFVSVRPLLGAGTDCLTLSFLSAWWSYYLLISRI